MANTFLIAALLPVLLPAPDKNDDSLLQRAERRIEQIRKVDARVFVSDRRGKPIRGATVHVEQIRHAFLFGCAAISLLKHGGSDQEEKYQKQFAALFNFATVLTYWQDTDPEPGRKSLGKLTAQVRWLKDHGFTVKGHPLILAGAVPKWAPSDPDEVRALTEKRIRDLTSRFEGRIDVWDVVGDATTAVGAQNGFGAWARKAGPARFTADALMWARAGNPKALLMYNDYKLDADYLNLIREIKGMGAPLATIGLEAHMIGSEWSMDKVWTTAETFAALGKPLHFSEITVLSDDQKVDHGRSWPSTPEGEQRQADYVEKLYTLLFSHPAVTGIGWWNFVDGDWDRMPGGLLRADLTPKPAYERLLRLIKGKWWTRAEAKTDRAGVAAIRGYAGRYRIRVASGGHAVEKEAELKRGVVNRIIVRIE